MGLMTEPPELDPSREHSADQDVDRQLNDRGPDTGASGWATLTDAASAVGVSSKTIRRAVKAGTIDGHRSSDTPDAPWLVRLEDVEAKWGSRARVSDSAGAAATPSSATEAETVEVESEEPVVEAGPDEPVVEAEPDEPVVEAEIDDQPGRGRLGELRKRLVVEEPQRRWWQRPKR
jgi:hypothetical protein